MRWETTLLQMGSNTGIEVPAEVIEALGGGKRAAVDVVVNGFAYKSTIGAMAGKSLVPFSSDKRAETGLAGGDAITVELTLDTTHVTNVEGAKAAETRQRRIEAIVAELAG